jgi:Mrp family chromosome partitioning ATPase/uncharacterized protein involved in exopolysaccharide biosynthesis
MNLERKSPLIASDHLQPTIRLARRTVRFWRVGLVTFAIGIAATLAVAELRPREYRSEAVVYYREGMQWTANESMSTRRIGQRLKDTLLARTQLAKVIEDLGLYPKLVKAGRIAEGVEEMRLATNFKFAEGDVFVISYTGDSPEQAQRVTATLTDLLIGENTRWRSEQAEVARAFLEAEKKRNEVDLAAKETAQVRFLAKHPEFAHEQGRMGVGLRAKATKSSDADAPLGGDSALRALRRGAERLRLQLRSPGQVPRAPQDPALVAARNEAAAKLKTAQRELADRRARFTDQHPDVRSAAAMVKEAGDAHRAAVDALDATESAVPRAALETELQQVQQDIVDHQRRHPKEKAAPDDPVEASEAAQRVVARETEWARLSREVAEARERFQQLDSRQFVASMTLSTLMSGQAAQIVVIDPAFLPASPIGMSRTRLYLIGILMALAMGIGLAMTFALLDDRIYDHVDVERLELAPVLIEVARDALPESGGPAGEKQQEGAAAGPAREEQRQGDAPPEGDGATRERSREADGGDGRPGGTYRPDKEFAAALVTLQSALRDALPAGTLAPAKELAKHLGADVALAASGPDRALASTRTAGPQALKLESVPRAESVAAEAAPAEAAPAEAAPAPAPAAAELEPKPRNGAGATVWTMSDIVRVHRVATAARLDPRLIVLRAPDSRAAASFRVLRHRLCERSRGKAILVTSPGVGEGKTMCAVNLALALGEAGRARVLLLEGNFRSPSLARLLGFEPPACFSKQLDFKGIQPVQWVVVETVVPWLHVAAVAPGTAPGPILDGPALALCIEDLRGAGYDHIVIDGPAILGSADVNLMEENVDGILIALWAEKSRAQALREAVEQIGMSKLSGVVLFGT